MNCHLIGTSEQLALSHLFGCGDVPRAYLEVLRPERLGQDSESAWIGEVGEHELEHPPPEVRSLEVHCSLDHRRLERERATHDLCFCRDGGEGEVLLLGHDCQSRSSPERPRSRQG